jgi:hypothetical protein
MTTVSLDTATAEKFSLSKSLSWRDSHLNCTLAVAQPSTDPELWSEFVAGAYRSYRTRGVEMRSRWTRCAPDPTRSCSSQGSTMPADDSDAVVECAGQPSQQAKAG